MNKQPQQIYIVNSVEDGLPEESGKYLCMNRKLKMPFEVFYNADNKTFSLDTMTFFIRNTGITHWLSPLNAIVLTVEEWEGVKKCLDHN